jgi:hypothetical protein
MARLLDCLVTPALAANLARIAAANFALRKTTPKAKTSSRNREWIEGKLKRLTEVYVEGDLTQPEYHRRRAALQSELDRLDAPSELEPPRLPENVLRNFEEYIADPSVPIATKRIVVASLIDRILIGAEEITIHYRPFSRLGWRVEETIRRPLPHETPYKRPRGKNKAVDV